jgi:hypothetical protein
VGTRVQLPAGCYGIQCADGSSYTANPGSHIEVSDRHAAAIRQSQHQAIGMLNGTQGHYLGTKKGRWCQPCRFLAQAWSIECPRCGRATEAE